MGLGLGLGLGLGPGLGPGLGLGLESFEGVDHRGDGVRALVVDGAPPAAREGGARVGQCVEAAAAHRDEGAPLQNAARRHELRREDHEARLLIVPD